MDHAEYVAAIRAEGAALVDAAERAGVDSTVPSCPAWTVADLLGHVGRIHRWIARLVVERAGVRGAHWSEADAPAPRECIAWFTTGVGLLGDALDDAGPDIEVWSWTVDTTTGFWARRMANETAVHRYDAQLAAGDAEPIAHAQAVDAIDEFFDLIPYMPWSERVRGTGETLHFHATDGADDHGGEWFLQLGAGGLDVTRAHAKGDVAVRGTASDLLLFQFGRVGLDRVEVFGDATVLTRWRELSVW